MSLGRNQDQAACRLYDMAFAVVLELGNRQRMGWALGPIQEALPEQGSLRKG